MTVRHSRNLLYAYLINSALPVSDRWTGSGKRETNPNFWKLPFRVEFLCSKSR